MTIGLKKSKEMVVKREKCIQCECRMITVARFRSDRRCDVVLNVQKCCVVAIEGVLEVAHEQR